MGAELAKGPIPNHKGLVGMPPAAARPSAKISHPEYTNQLRCWLNKVQQEQKQIPCAEYSEYTLIKRLRK
jgi:hypothetical protein